MILESNEYILIFLWNQTLISIALHVIERGYIINVRIGGNTEIGKHPMHIYEDGHSLTHMWHIIKKIIAYHYWNGIKTNPFPLLSWALSSSNPTSYYLLLLCLFRRIWNTLWNWKYIILERGNSCLEKLKSMGNSKSFVRKQIWIFLSNFFLSC